MQGDLISKKEVINLLCNLHIDNIAVNDKRVTEYIREMPTAYDVEKVVDNVQQIIQEEIDIALKDVPDGGEYTEDAYRLLFRNTQISDAIRNGGKE